MQNFQITVRAANGMTVRGIFTAETVEEAIQQAKDRAGCLVTVVSAKAV